MNKKKKSTNTSPYPDEVIDRLARAFYPAILACWNSEEGQREFAAWQAEQAHHANNEKQEVPTGELPVVHIAIVCGFWQGVSYSGAHPVFVLPSIFMRRKGAEVFCPALAAGGSLMAYKCLSLCGLFFFKGFCKSLFQIGFDFSQVVSRPLHCEAENLLLFRVSEIAGIVFERFLP